MPHANLNADLKDLFWKAFSYCSQDRLSIAELRNHPWMQGEVAEYTAVQNFMKQCN